MREVIKMKTLSETILELKKRNPNVTVVLKTERYGMFWAGKIKFALSGYSFDAGRSEVKLIEYRQNDIAITI